MKQLVNLISIALVLVLTQCMMKPTKSEKVAVYASQARLGYHKNKTVVEISDFRGEQYLIDYSLYRSLFYKQGYNGVIKFYYSHPSDERLYVVGESFKPSNSVDADTMANHFYESYLHTIAADSLYVPKSSLVNKSISVRKQINPSYNPSTARPI